MRLRLVLALCGVLAGQAHGQAASAAQAAKPEFEVATVRPSEQLDQGKVMAMVQAGKMPKFGPHIDGLRAEYDRMPLKALIARAYDVKDYQVTVPKDTSNEPFDIVATMPEGSTKDDAPKMLRTLLEERFKLEAKETNEEQPVYALVVGKGGPKLKESATKPAPIDPDAQLKSGQTRVDGPFGPMIMTRNPDGTSTANMGEKGSYAQRVDVQSKTLHLDGTALTMRGFAEMMTLLSTSIPGGTGARPIIDMTGLKGYYDVSVELSLAALMPPPPPGSAAATEASAPSGSLGLEESIQKMGLKLEPQKAPIEQVVVSHVEKMPTEN